MENNVETNVTVMDTQMNSQKNSKFYTIFNYKMARYLLKNGCTIADIGLNKNTENSKNTIVFHFVRDEKLLKLVNIRKEIIKLQKETKNISNSTDNIVKNTTTIKNN